MKSVKTHLTILWSLAVASGCLQAEPLPRATPESQGLPAAAMIDFITAADNKIDTLHSFMIVRRGHAIAEAWWAPESPETPHVMWSLTKSFTATGIGLAIADGKLALDDKVLDFFPEETPAEPSANLQAMTVRDLLTMTCGHETEPPREPEGPTVKAFLAHPVPNPPGTRFLYNSAGSFMLSAILTKATGENLGAYLGKRLFEPLEIDNPRWDRTPEGYSNGGYGLWLRTEDIAKFGQLHLQKGLWNDRQLIPATWIAEATRKQVSNETNPAAADADDWQQGYGYQFWMCRNNAFRGDGKDGQFCIVIPEHELVIAITANTAAMQNQLNVIWETILPALQTEALPDDLETNQKLAALITKLRTVPGEDP